MHRSALGRRAALSAVSLVTALLLSACGGGTSTPTATPIAAVDLARWKLDLPVDASGGTGGIDGVQYAARTVLPDALVAGFSDAWFQVDAQGSIVFTAPANGAVTTPGVGTDHTRSELREFERNGDAQGDWTGRGTLAATCEVRQVASASPVAIIGQLRSEGHVFAQMQYRTASRDVAVDVYQANATGSAHAATVLATGVSLSQAIMYALSFDGAMLTATVNGATRTFAVDAGWASAPLYFKVGAYHSAPNTGNPPGDATVVACSRIAVTH